MLFDHLLVFTTDELWTIVGDDSVGVTKHGEEFFSGACHCFAGVCHQFFDKWELRVIVGDDEIHVTIEGKEVSAYSVPWDHRCINWLKWFFSLKGLVLLVHVTFAHKILNVVCDAWPVDAGFGTLLTLCNSLVTIV